MKTLLGLITLVSLSINIMLFWIIIAFPNVIKQALNHPNGTNYVTITNDYNQGASDMFDLFDHRFVRGRADPNSTDIELFSFILDIRMKSISNNDFSFLRKSK